MKRILSVFLTLLVILAVSTAYAKISVTIGGKVYESDSIQTVVANAQKDGMSVDQIIKGTTDAAIPLGEVISALKRLQVTESAMVEGMMGLGYSCTDVTKGLKDAKIANDVIAGSVIKAGCSPQLVAEVLGVQTPILGFSTSDQGSNPPSIIINGRGGRDSVSPSSL